MPQNRRKVAYSGKKKKDQLVLKRQMKTSQKYLRTTHAGSQEDDDGETTEDNELVARKLMEQPLSRGNNNKNINRYNLQFNQESRRDLEQAKQMAYRVLDAVSPEQREINAANCYSGYDFPVRPAWKSSMDKVTLESNEQRYFREYTNALQKRHKSDGKDLSLYELNVETWRQLWRVLEISDVLLIIVDVRYAILMFPPALYAHITQTLHKRAILVLNKVDLVTAETVVAWRHYFRAHYADLPVVLFASYPARALRGTRRGRRAHKRCMEGVLNIQRACQQLIAPADGTAPPVDLATWEQKILEDMRTASSSYDDDEDENTSATAAAVTTRAPAEAVLHPKDDEPHILCRNGVLTMGCIGFPNVGKSSLINALKGRKVVSVSRTPGHTKHFQTIFLTPTVRLCDCPGLVFPSATPKHLQVLIGSFPISQLQVPYPALKFLAEHLQLPQLLKLQLPSDYDEWSASAVADAWALKRGFLTAKAARPDRYRAANHLLRLCLAGQQQLVLQFYPPDFSAQQEKWLQHSDMQEVIRYQQTQLDDDDEDGGERNAAQENKEDTSSVNSESMDSDDSDGSNSSNDESAGDEAAAAERNAFALLADD